jgi:hypothetical protein
LPPGSFTAISNTTADLETHGELQDDAFKKEAAPKGFAAARSEMI